MTSPNAISDLCSHIGSRCPALRLFQLPKFPSALAGNDGQDVDVMHVILQHVGVHAFPVLVDTEAQATAHLLTLTDIAAALL